VSSFVPPFSYVSGISQAQNAVATFTSAHDFSNGEYISFRVSKPYGMVEINNQRGLVLANDTFTVTTDIDSSFYTPFIYPIDGSITPNTPPVAVPAGSGIIPNYAPATVTLFDAFDNVIPGVGGQ
jgi:hypothetical protein